MASASLLRQIFDKLAKQDLEGAVSVANAIIQEAEQKGHRVLANDLQKILSQIGTGLQVHSQLKRMSERLPVDPTSQLALVSIQVPNRSLNDLVLASETRTSLERVVLEYTSRSELSEQKLNYASRVLFVGPPGCGKTSAAHAIAKSLGLPLLYVRLDALISSFLGETATNLRQVFEFYENHPCVLLFDEFDAVAKERNDASDVGELKRVVSSFLQILDQTEQTGIVLCATNHATLLDTAVWRRFDQVITFPKPDDHAIRKLIKSVIPNRGFPDEFLEMFANMLSGASFADVERVCIEARKTAVLDRLPTVTEAHVHRSLVAYQKRVSQI